MTRRRSLLRGPGGYANLAANKGKRCTMTATVAETGKLSGSALWRLRIGFILVPFVHSAGMNVVIVFGMRFLTDNLAMAAVVAGGIQALVKIYDAILDPTVGAWSDSTRSRWGRRLPFLFAGAVMMPIGIALVFNTPDFQSVLMAQIFLFFALGLHASAYTLLTIPGMAMLVESTDDYHQRTTLMAYRTVGNSIGLAAGTSVPAWLLAYWGTTKSGHISMAWVIAGVTLVAGLTAIWCLRDAPQTRPDETKTRYSIAKQVKLAWDNVPFRLLAIAHVFVLLATVVASSATPYFTKYVLQQKDGFLAWYFLLASIGPIVSMPMWVWFSKRFGKKQAYITALGLFGLIHLAWFTATASEPVYFLALRGFIKGIASGGVILTAYTMLSDAVRYDYIKSGLRREGAFAGFTTLFDKLSQAFGVAIMGAFLSAMGYVASKTGTAVQPPSAILAVTLCMTVIPLAMMSCAMLSIRTYKLDEEDLIQA